jgi:hypothetical protein
MLIVAVKLKAGLDGHRLESFINKWVPELERSTRIGSLNSLKMFSSSHTGTRRDEFVLTIDGFVQAPPMEGLEELGEVIYSFECEETGSWPKGKKH